MREDNNIIAKKMAWAAVKHGHCLTNVGAFMLHLKWCTEAVEMDQHAQRPAASCYKVDRLC